MSVAGDAAPWAPLRKAQGREPEPGSAGAPLGQTPQRVKAHPLPPQVLTFF